MYSSQLGHGHKPNSSQIKIKAMIDIFPTVATAVQAWAASVNGKSFFWKTCSRQSCQCLCRLQRSVRTGRRC